MFSYRAAMSRSQSIDRSQMETIGEEERGGGDPHHHQHHHHQPRTTNSLPYKALSTGGAKTKIATPVSSRKNYARRH